MKQGSNPRRLCNDLAPIFRYLDDVEVYCPGKPCSGASFTPYPYKIVGKLELKMHPLRPQELLFTPIYYLELTLNRPFLSRMHRHLREIDCSLAIVGRQAAGAESGGKSIHWTLMWRQKVLHSGCCGWQHNYYSQQRQAGQANEQSTSLRCLCLHVTLILYVIAAALTSNF